MNRQKKNSSNLYQERGFTILEIVVGINLSFLLLTFIISFYLFTYKLSSSIQNKIVTNNDMNNFLFRLEEKLHRADMYFIESSANQIMVVINNADSVLVTDTLLNFSNIFFVNSFDEFSLEIQTDEGEIINHSVTKDEESSGNFGSERINSENIDVIRFNIIALGKTFSSTFYRNRNSAIGFRNIR